MTRWAAVGVTVVLAISAAVGPMGSAAAADVPDTWASELGGGGNTRMNPGETVLTPAVVPRVQLGWTRADPVSGVGAPTVVDGVGYEVVDASGANRPSVFQAFSVRTGRTQWSVPLPKGGTYPRGVTVVSHVALLSFDGVGARAGGVTAVGLTGRRVIWSVAQPAGAAGSSRTVTGQLVSDGSFAYLLSAARTVTAYQLSDGARLWRTVLTGPVPDGIAVGNKIVYTGAATGVIAYDTTTGKQLWTAPGLGAPVVTGGRVITAGGTDVVALQAAGCGASSCDPLWRTTLPYRNVGDLRLGGVDATYGYVTYTDTVARTGGLVRFGAISGRVIWRAPLAAAATAPVRGASTVWTVVGQQTLVGFASDATATRPLVSLTLPAAAQVPDQNLALATGRVFVRSAPDVLTSYGPPAA